MDDIGWFIHANQEMMKLQGTLPESLAEGCKPNFATEQNLEEDRLKAFVKKICGTSLVHASCEFKDSSSAFTQSVVGRGCRIGANVKL